MEASCMSRRGVLGLVVGALGAGALARRLGRV